MNVTLRRATTGLPCEVLLDGPGVGIDDRTAYDADALVFCAGTPAPSAMLIPNPEIAVEVLSPTTSHHDASAKLIGYFKLPSIAHYLIIDPDARTVTHYPGRGTPSVLSAGPLGLDPPRLDLAVEDLFGRA